MTSENASPVRPSENTFYTQLVATLAELEQHCRATTWNNSGQIRCALIASSIRTILRCISPELLRLLVETGIWNSDTALTHLHHIDEYQRAASLITVAPVLPPDLLPNILAMAQDIKNDRFRADALGGLVTYLPSVLQIQTVSTVRLLPEEIRAFPLSQIVPQLPVEMRSELIDETLTVLPMTEIHSTHSASEIIANLVNHLTPRLASKALTTALTIRPIGAYVRALDYLLPHLTEIDLSPEIWIDTLTVSRKIWDDTTKAEALGTLLPYLSSELQEETLNDIRMLEDEHSLIALVYAVKYLRHSKLAAEMQDELIAEAVRRAQAAQSAGRGNERLAQLAEHLAPTTPLKALTIAQSITNPQQRSQAQSLIVAYLPAEIRVQTALETLSLSQTISLERSANTAILSQLIPHLPSDLQHATMTKTLALLATGYSSWTDSDTLERLMPYLSPERFNQILLMIQSSGGAQVQAELMVRLGDYLPADVKRQLTSKLMTQSYIIGFQGQAEAMCSLALFLPHTLQSQILKEFLANLSTHNYTNRSYLSDVLFRQMSLLPTDTFAHLLRTLWTSENANARDWSISTLAEQIPSEVMPEALSIARTI